MMGREGKSEVLFHRHSFVRFRIVFQLLMENFLVICEKWKEPDGWLNLEVSVKYGVNNGWDEAELRLFIWFFFLSLLLVIGGRSRVMVLRLLLLLCIVRRNYVRIFVVFYKLLRREWEDFFGWWWSRVFSRLLLLFCEDFWKLRQIFCFFFFYKFTFLWCVLFLLFEYFWFCETEYAALLKGYTVLLKGLYGPTKGFIRPYWRSIRPTEGSIRPY